MYVSIGGPETSCIIESRTAAPLSGTVYPKHSRVSLQIPLAVVISTPENFSSSKQALVNSYGNFWSSKDHRMSQKVSSINFTYTFVSFNNSVFINA